MQNQDANVGRPAAGTNRLKQKWPELFLMVATGVLMVTVVFADSKAATSGAFALFSAAEAWHAKSLGLVKLAKVSLALVLFFLVFAVVGLLSF